MYASSGPTADRCEFSIGEYIDGKWKIESFLGEGTFGQVFKVRDSAGNIHALKLLKLWEVPRSERLNLLKRFDREFETGKINSDHLVHSLQKGDVKGNAYIVMEYFPYGDVYSAMSKMNLDMGLIASHILYGLRDLHKNGKVHRDLKPENVLLKDSKHAALSDFGICGDQNNRLTQRGWMGVPQERFGTIAYMPPEQINPKRGNATVLPTTDIFSFGVMMYQLLARELPFGPLRSDSDVPRYIFNVQQGSWDRNGIRAVQQGEQWLLLIEGCLVPDFRNRLQNVDAVLQLVPQRTPPCSINIPQSPRPPHSGGGFYTDDRYGLLLRIMQGEEPGKTYHLNSYSSGGTVIFVGRKSPDIWNHISIKEEESAYISRQHCTIEKNNTTNEWLIRDGQYRIPCETGYTLESTFPCATCPSSCAVQKLMSHKASTNGTFVNSEEVTAHGIKIKVGDIISLGDVKLRVEGVDPRYFT